MLVRTADNLCELRLSITTTSPVFQCRTQHLRDESQEDVAVGGFFDGHRGNNFLYAFKADFEAGKLTPMKRSNCGGKTPRNFTLDPTERWMLVANQDSNLISVFARDHLTGELADVPKSSVEAEAPMRILFGSRRELVEPRVVQSPVPKGEGRGAPGIIPRTSLILQLSNSAPPLRKGFR